MLGFLLCGLFTLLELFTSVLLPGYLSLKLISRSNNDEGRKISDFKHWAFYWIITISAWRVFAYLTFIPYVCVLRLVLSVALVSPKIDLVGKVVDLFSAEGVIGKRVCGYCSLFCGEGCKQ